MDRKTIKPEVEKILLTESVLSERIAKLAEQIKAAYVGSDKVIVLVLLNGAKRFTDELLARINEDKFEPRYIKAGSYKGTQSDGKLTFAGYIGDVSGQEVLIADDIYDSGTTLSGTLEMVRQAGSKQIRTCCLLEKNTMHKMQLKIDFKAAVVPDCFVVGYGLDYNGQYRDLPFVAQLDLDGS